MGVDILKKHIIIAGVPRAGKSTAAQWLSRRLGYQHISMDSVIAGIERAFPETGVNSDADTDVLENIRYISSRMGPFLRAMMDSGEYDECGYGMVIDIFQLLPEHYARWIDPSVCGIFYLGTSDVTAEERWELLKRYDTPKDYTYYRSEAENRRDCADIVEISRFLKEQCELFRLPYYDTSRDRERVLRSALGLQEG